MQQKIYLKTNEEKAAAEYLEAFIKHLFNKGLTGIEIARRLDISLALLDRLSYDEAMLAELKRRNDELVWPIIKDTPDKQERYKKLKELQIAYDESWGEKYFDSSHRFTTIGPWQRNHHFQNAVQYHYQYKKKYSENDNDVIASLSTGVAIAESKDKLPDRSLTPEYKMRIVNDLSDGLTMQDISEKYNCSLLAVNEVVTEQGLTIPVADESVEERISQAIKEGYNLEQLTNRFKNTNPQKIAELIKTIRILPATGE